MTKTDINDQDTRQELKKEIMTEIKQDARRRKLVNCLGCLTLEILAILIPLVFVASLLARSGLVNVPLLTSRLYRPSEPTRLVRPLVGSSASDIIVAEATKPKVNPNFGTVTISFTEAELTTIAQEGLAVAGNSLPMSISSVQLAVDPDAIELFATSPKSGREVTIRARFVPTVESGRLKLTVKELRIGALDVPPSASGMLTALLDQSIGKTIDSSVGQIGTLVGIQTEKGVMRVEIVPNKSKL